MAIIYYLQGGGISSFLILWFSPLWSDLLFLNKTCIIHLYKTGMAVLIFYTVYFSVKNSDGESVALLS